MRYWRRTRQVHQTDGLACPEGGADPNNRPQDSFVNHSGPSVEVTLKFDGHEPGGTYYDKSGLAAGRLVDSSDVVQGRIVDNSNLCVLVERGLRILLCVVNTRLCLVRFLLDSRLMPLCDLIKSVGPSLKNKPARNRGQALGSSKPSTLLRCCGVIMFFIGPHRTVWFSL